MLQVKAVELNDIYILYTVANFVGWAFFKKIDELNFVRRGCLMLQSKGKETKLNSLDTLYLDPSKLYSVEMRNVDPAHFMRAEVTSLTCVHFVQTLQTVDGDSQTLRNVENRHITRCHRLKINNNINDMLIANDRKNDLCGAAGTRVAIVLP